MLTGAIALDRLSLETRCLLSAALQAQDRRARWELCSCQAPPHRRPPSPDRRMGRAHMRPWLQQGWGCCCPRVWEGLGLLGGWGKGAGQESQVPREAWGGPGRLLGGETGLGRLWSLEAAEMQGPEEEECVRPVRAQPAGDPGLGLKAALGGSWRLVGPRGSMGPQWSRALRVLARSNPARTGSGPR